LANYIYVSTSFVNFGASQVIKDKSSIVLIFLSGGITAFSVFVLAIAIFHKKLYAENNGLIFFFIAQIIILALHLGVIVSTVFPTRSKVQRLYFIHKFLLFINCLQLVYFFVLFAFDQSKTYELAILFLFLTVYSFTRVANLRRELA
jgi:hypothetical protein